jgi:hypothetical protein
MNTYDIHEILPQEIISHIISFVEDRIYVSMVCKSWIGMLDKDKVIPNDSYSLKQYSLQYDIITTLDHNVVMNMSNYNSLKFLTYKLCELRDNRNLSPGENPFLCRAVVSWTYNILCKLCEYNYIFEKHHLRDLFRYMGWETEWSNDSNSTKIVKLINTAFEYKSYKILPLILSYSSWSKFWDKSVKHRYLNKLNCKDELINEIEFLQKSHILSYLEIYKQLCATHYYVRGNDYITGQVQVGWLDYLAFDSAIKHISQYIENII